MWQVRKRYFTNVDMESEEEFRPKFVEFLTDLMYSRCTDQFARLLVNHSVPTYEYSFEYRGQYSIVNLQGEQVCPSFPYILHPSLSSLHLTSLHPTSISV